VVGWETIRKLALALPGAEEEPGERPGFRVNGRLFAWRSRERDGGTLAVRVDREDKDLLLQARPDLYFQTPHYHGYPGLLVHIDVITEDEVRDLLEDAWLTRVPKRVARQFLDSR
jgi:hypothetical protein